MAQRSPGCTTVPPSARTCSSASAMSSTVKYGSENGVTRPQPALMDAEPQTLRARLPALSLRALPSPQLGSEQLRPEPPGAGRVVGGELDQGSHGFPVHDVERTAAVALPHARTAAPAVGSTTWTGVWWEDRRDGGQGVCDPRLARLQDGDADARVQADPLPRHRAADGSHPMLVRAAGFPGHSTPIRTVDGATHSQLAMLDRFGTVPALLMDGERVQTNHKIARHLERVCPDPPLFPVRAGAS